MRPIMAVLALLLTLSACTIREETFAPKDDGRSDGFSFQAPGDANAPAEGDRASCPGALARGSDIQLYREGTQELFCN
jgi:hypothetical protein